jgi:hypothetical protein
MMAENDFKSAADALCTNPLDTTLPDVAVWPTAIMGR